jgi:hypothetical protein
MAPFIEVAEVDPAPDSPLASVLLSKSAPKVTFLIAPVNPIPSAIYAWTVLEIMLITTEAPTPTLASPPVFFIAAPAFTVPSLAEAAVMTTSLSAPPTAVISTGLSV